MSEDELVKFELKWREIYSEGIEKVFRIAETKQKENFDLKEYMRLYNMVYDICMSKSVSIQEKCYERLCDIMKNYCNKVYEKITIGYSRNILKEFVENWVTFDETVLKWILKFFMFLVNFIF